MLEKSSKWVALINSWIIFFSIITLGCGSLSFYNAAGCDNSLPMLTIVLGVILLAVSLAGVIGAAYRVNWLLGLHLLAMFLLIVALLCFIVFTFTGAGNWVQKRVNNDGEEWNRIKTCLIDRNFCKIISVIKQVNQTCQARANFLAKTLTPIESGCCKIPESCKSKYKNSTNPDCNDWRNDPKTLCFNCQSCKAGVRKNIKSNWTDMAIVNLCFVIHLIAAFFFGCCAFYDVWRDNSIS